MYTLKTLPMQYDVDTLRVIPMVKPLNELIEMLHGFATKYHTNWMANAMANSMADVINHHYGR